MPNWQDPTQKPPPGPQQPTTVENHYHKHDYYIARDAETVQFEKQVLGKLNQLLSKLDKLATKENAEMASLDDIKAAVSRNKDATDSAVMLIQQIAQKLQDAINANDPAAMQQIVDDLKAQDDALAAAVTANTPSDPGNNPNVNT